MRYASSHKPTHRMGNQDDLAGVVVVTVALDALLDLGDAINDPLCRILIALQPVVAAGVDREVDAAEVRGKLVFGERRLRRPAIVLGRDGSFPELLG